MRIALQAPVAAAKSIARRLAGTRQIGFWMRELDPTFSLSAVHARVVDVLAETHDVRTFVLAPNRLWPGHRAGQYVSVEVEVDGVRMERCYSVSSAPGQERVAITVKRAPGGRVSSWMHDHVRRGAVLRLGMPAGEFVLPDDGPRKLLLLSGGSGVTPVMSILRDLARRNAIADVVFVHAARSERDVVFERELRQLAASHDGLRLAFCLEDDPIGGGRLAPARLLSAVPDLAERHTMMCGPAAMMDALRPTWTDAGLEHRLRTERFALAPRTRTLAPCAASKIGVALVRSGRTVLTEPTDTLLEQLERAGERPPNGCRMGICNTCRCRKRAGVVEDVVTGEISSEPDVDIRLCVSRARTDVELAL